LVNLHVSEQQYAYARYLRHSVAIIVFNNDDKQAEIEFDVSPLFILNGTLLHDRLGVARDVIVRDDKIKVGLPKRSVAIFAIHSTQRVL
jgi:hypothetical protein